MVIASVVGGDLWDKARKVRRVIGNMCLLAGHCSVRLRLCCVEGCHPVLLPVAPPQHPSVPATPGTQAYMVAHPRPFMRMLHSVLSGNWMGEAKLL